MKIINSDKLFKIISDVPMYDNQDREIFLDIISDVEEDPMRAIGKCYCKECWYYTEWGECKEFGDIMMPEEFCSRGVIKDDIFS